MRNRTNIEWPGDTAHLGHGWAGEVPEPGSDVFSLCGGRNRRCRCDNDVELRAHSGLDKRDQVWVLTEVQDIHCG